MLRLLQRPAGLISLVLLIAGCSTLGWTVMESEQMFGPVEITDHRKPFDSHEAITYREDIEPVLNQRCVVCHACYDAPCQLKLSSPEGIMRGANPQKVYHGTRLLAAEPTRLGIDAQTTAGWREKGFHPVINERNQDPQTNLANSLIYQVLAQKKNHPLPDKAILPDDFDLSLNREQMCSTREKYADYLDEHPLWGMPYALPALNDTEYLRLTQWIKDGAPMSAPRPLPDDIIEKVADWEAYLNGDSLKQQLASRYMYEHLFLASLYFSDLPLFVENAPETPPSVFFRLVRSYTPPGEPISVVATRRPYDDPGLGEYGVERIYYRLQHDTEVKVAKTHMPYRLNEQRMDWMKSLFDAPDYEVTKLPGYDNKVSSNPFIAFDELPVSSRYRFMLEEAEYTIRGFIKGPVCRGQVALNVIDDQFWAFFSDPEWLDSPGYEEFLKDQSKNLHLPGEAESNANPLTNWLKYSSLHQKYLQAKNEVLVNIAADLDISTIWDGDGHNPNASLTIMRHFDSSSVVQGLVGQTPKTVWLVDYGLLERIHYLLVAEFDVFGNVGHQLMTRLYMDFLRMEGEQNFLTMLPHDERIKLAEYWYRDATDEVDDYLVNTEEDATINPGIEYQTDDPKTELLGMLRERLQGAQPQKYSLAQHLTPEMLSILNQLNEVTGRSANVMPELSFIMVEDMNGAQQVFTLMRVSGHSNLTGLLYEEENRLPDEDYLTLVPGIIGTYPGAFFRFSSFRADRFVDAVEHLKSEDDYRELMERFGVRRTDISFWQHSDQLHDWFRKNDPMYAGILDYNRLENR